MAQENLGKIITLEASADLSSSQFCFVTCNSTPQVALTGDGADASGVLQNKPSAAGRAADVMVGAGQTKVKSGAAITAGAWCASDASGRAVTAVSGDYVLGQALEAATAANQYVSFLFTPRGKL